MTRIIGVWITAFLALLLLIWWTHQATFKFVYPSFLTGWYLFGVLAALALFNIRKKLSSLPLANSSSWLSLHLPGGFLAMGIFWIHAGVQWPTGAYEKFLAILFYMTFVTGVLGLAIQRSFPKRLTQSGEEYIFERIPMEIVEIQRQAKKLLLTCTRETRRDNLATQFMDRLDWYFQQPRFLLNHVLGGKKSETWIHQQYAEIELALNPQERTYLQKLFALANTKKNIDLHFALQSVLKGWLLFHLPIATALMTLGLWHLLVVYVYFL